VFPLDKDLHGCRLPVHNLQEAHNRLTKFDARGNPRYPLDSFVTFPGSWKFQLEIRMQCPRLVGLIISPG